MWVWPRTCRDQKRAFRNLLPPRALFSWLFSSLWFWQSQTSYYCFFLTTATSELLVLLDDMDKAATRYVERSAPSWDAQCVSVTSLCCNWYLFAVLYRQGDYKQQQGGDWHRSRSFLFFQMFEMFVVRPYHRWHSTHYYCWIKKVYERVTIEMRRNRE